MPPIPMANLQEELKKIPDEYQTIFRETIEREIREGGHNDTDEDRLAYLRRRQEDIRKGAYIRPDGRSALITATHPDELYGDGGVDGLATAGDEVDRRSEQRQKLLKIGAIVVMAMAFILFVSWSARQRAQARETEDGEETAVTDTIATGEPTAATATPPLPELTEASASLQTIGSLGAALQLGRPGALELHFQQTEEVVALAVDPARVTPQGELPFNEAAMTSNQPLAVWVQGTVLNYAMGIPDPLAQNLAAGDRIILSTDTGQTLHFVVTEVLEGNIYDSARYLSQDRIGMTLFSLPAPAENEVQFAYANYDIASEDEQVFEQAGLGEPFDLTVAIRLVVEEVSYEHRPDGLVAIQVSGRITQSLRSQDHMMLSLASGAEQTQSMNLNHQQHRWLVEFTATDSFLGADVFAEFRAIPANELQTVHLGYLPALDEQMQVSLTQAYWRPETRQAVVRLLVQNPGPATVRLGPSFFNLKGGEAQPPEIYFQPFLPVLLESQAEISLELSFLAANEPIILTAGDGRWQLAAIPPISP